MHIDRRRIWISSKDYKEEKTEGIGTVDWDILKSASKSVKLYLMSFTYPKKVWNTTSCLSKKKSETLQQTSFFNMNFLFCFLFHEKPKMKSWVSFF